MRGILRGMRIMVDVVRREVAPGTWDLSYVCESLGIATRDRESMSDAIKAMLDPTGAKYTVTQGDTNTHNYHYPESL